MTVSWALLVLEHFIGKATKQGCLGCIGPCRAYVCCHQLISIPDCSFLSLPTVSVCLCLSFCLSAIGKMDKLRNDPPPSCTSAPRQGKKTHLGRKDQLALSQSVLWASFINLIKQSVLPQPATGLAVVCVCCFFGGGVGWGGLQALLFLFFFSFWFVWGGGGGEGEAVVLES